MNLQVATIPEIVSRGATYILLVCLLLLFGVEVTNLVPFDHRRIAYRAAKELIFILVLLRFEDSSFVRNMIDIGIYGLLAKLALLLSYFAYIPAYNWIGKYLFDPLMITLFVLSIARLLWISKVGLSWSPGNWPPIGPHGWLAPKLAHMQPISRMEYILIGLTIVSCIAFGLAMAGAPDVNGYLNALVASAGVLGVAIYTKPLGRGLQLLLMTSEERHAAILQYEEAIIRSAAALAELRKLEAEKEPKPERQNVVQLVRTKPEPDASAGAPGTEKGTDKGPTDGDTPA